MESVGILVVCRIGLEVGLEMAPKRVSGGPKCHASGASGQPTAKRTWMSHVVVYNER